MRSSTILSLILFLAFNQSALGQDVAMDEKVNSILAKIQRLKAELNEAKGLQEPAQSVLDGKPQATSTEFVPFVSDPLPVPEPLPQAQSPAEFRNIASADSSSDTVLVAPTTDQLSTGALPNTMPSVMAPQGSIVPANPNWHSQSRVVHQPLPPADAVYAPPVTGYPPTALEGYYEAQPYRAAPVWNRSSTFHGATVPQTLPRQAIPPQAYGVYQDQPLAPINPNPAFAPQVYQPNYHPAWSPGFVDPGFNQGPIGNGLYFGPNGWGVGVGGVQLHFRGNQGRGNAGHRHPSYGGHPGKGHGGGNRGRGNGKSR